MTSASDLVLAARVGGSLAVVLLVAVLAARLARRAGGRTGRGTIAVRERVGLTRDASAVLLEADGRLLVLGVTPHQVCLLAELGPSGTVVAVPPGQPAAAVTAGPAGAVAATGGPVVPAQRGAVRVVAGVPSAPPLTRRQLRTVAGGRRRPAMPPTQRGTGSVLDPRTWQQGLEALRDATARRG